MILPWTRRCNRRAAHHEARHPRRGTIVTPQALDGPPLDDGEELSPEMVAMGVETKPYIRIRRINPRNGRVMWDYYQPRGPLDVRIQDNTFQLVLKKEVQVLRFLSF